MKKPKRVKGKVASWLYSGGGGIETAPGDEKSLSMSFYGLVEILESYEMFLKEKISKRIVLGEGYGWICGFVKDRGFFKMDIYKPLPKSMAGKKIRLIAELLNEKGPAKK